MANRKNTTMQAEEMQERLTHLENDINALVGVCKRQSDVIQSIMGTRPPQLENCTEDLVGLLSEEDSDMARARIRRRVTLNGQLTWITADTEQEYAEKLLKAANVATEPPKPDVPKHNFREYAQRWFDVFSKPNVETVTATTYARQLRLYLYPAFGEMFVEDINPSDVQALFNGIDGARETKLKVKMVLNMIFQQAMEDEIIVKNPLASKSIRINGRPSKPTEPYTVEQMQTIVSRIGQVEQPGDRAFIALMALHPLRLEETLGLKHGDIDRQRNVIHIERSVTHPTRNAPEIKGTKTEASRRAIDLATGILAWLPEGKPDDFIFGGERPLSYTQVRRMCRRIQKDIAFEEAIQPRRFRTTVLTDIYDATKDIKKAQAAAGHTTAAMTLKHYVKGRQQKLNTANPISALYGLPEGAGM